MSDKDFDPVDEQLEEIFKGVRVKQSDLKDAAFSHYGSGNQSLLHKVISAITDNKNYRQELKTALWKDSDEADNAVAAIEECLALGMDPTPVIDQIIARSSGQNHSLLQEALRTLTHSSFTTNYQRNGNNGSKSKSNSPIP